ncbi:flagellar assembly protein A [Clostridium sp.]|uniref:flagellar assembly protein A n=1 Tax=Clostridium sp. TaxID=1506 RepID=UPI0026349C00|nr:flagellar assembly protein A [Clostridium sp.]
MEENSNKIYGIDGSVAINNKQIIVKNPKEKGKPATIYPSKKGKIILNGEDVNRPMNVTEKDEIIFEELVEKGKRIIDISLNRDKTEAYMQIQYIKEKIHSLKDSSETENLEVETYERDGEYPPLIREEEIYDYIRNQGINYGIENESIKLLKDDINLEKVLIAKGIKVIQPIEDELKMLFIGERDRKTNENSIKIDYRNINYITSVKGNEVLAEIIKGKNGIDGMNVFSEIIPSKPKKNVNYTAGQGCKIVDDKFISTIAGKPSFNKTSIWIEPIYVLNKDVTISTGNINFSANVEINGKVTEGMKVSSGGTLSINGGAFNSEIKANKTTKILGNIVNSTVDIGGMDLIKEERVNFLIKLKEELNSLFSNLTFIKEKSIVKNNISDGIMIKTLMESKYKSIPKIGIKIMSSSLKDNCYNSKVVKLIKEKLLGYGPSNIKNIIEIEGIINEINKELEEVKEESIIKYDLTIEYAQESKINVMGDIIVIGKGLFTSQLYSTNNIIFEKKSSVCRGGHLKAIKGIYGTTIGSDSGVATKLEVDNHGEIKTDIAYQNTIFIIGSKKYILDKPSKDIHIYEDKDGSLVVDKLLL